MTTVYRQHVTESYKSTSGFDDQEGELKLWLWKKVKALIILPTEYVQNIQGLKTVVGNTLFRGTFLNCVKKPVQLNFLCTKKGTNCIIFNPTLLKENSSCQMHFRLLAHTIPLSESEV